MSDKEDTGDVIAAIDAEKLFADLIKTAKNSDAFMFIPMSIEYEYETWHIEASIELNDQIGLQEGDEMLEMIYLSALGALLSSCMARLDKRHVIDYLTSVMEKIMEDEKNNVRH